jgi:hypothetical protein
MADSIDDITVSYTEEGVETVKELDKKILTRGAWTTIIFKYQDWNRAKGIYNPLKYTIRRYQKRNDSYWQKSKFNISSVDQAQQIISALQNWLTEDIETIEKLKADKPPRTKRSSAKKTQDEDK